MNKRIYARLAELENASKATSLVSSAPWRDASSAEELREALRAHGFEQRETEGLMGTLARFLGITMQDLKVHLQAIMYGHANKAELTNEQHH